MAESDDGSKTEREKEALRLLAHVPSPAEIAAQRRPVVMPTRGGMKDFAWDGSDRQRDKLDAFHESNRVLFAEEHTCNEKTLSIGEWKPKRDHAEIHVAKGQCWKWMGHSACGQLLVFPEEALFLLETGHLELRLDGLPMTIQQAFHVLTHNSLTLHEYQAYAMLVRSGLMVFRSSKRTASLIGPEATLARKRGGAVRDDESDRKRAAAARPTTQNRNGPTATATQSNPNPIVALAVDVACASLARDVVCASVLALSALLPVRKPLVCRSDAVTTEAILKKLSIFKTPPSPFAASAAPSGKRFCLSFEVYKFRPRFKKTDRGRPNYYVAVASCAEAPPTLGEINSLSRIADGIPVKWAMIDSGSVSFYDFMDVQLPTVVSKG
ncbi:tRNA-splicing endonuclease subunit Sen54-like [Oscarella lobularis]|uniref:tRNA-splicing endonuclease subunit Sen54-like n=1 Tax=Oscarella lobularis TaxID=121494 RepID=UPI0033132459